MFINDHVHNVYKHYCLCDRALVLIESSHLSLVHFMVGAGSPTELQGRRTSFIQGVVTVPPKDRILAGTVHKQVKVIHLINWM